MAAPASNSMRSAPRAGHAIDQRDADQQQERSHQVHGDVLQPRADPRNARAVQQQAIGCRQQHFEENEQVEEVARQEGAVQAHQQELE
ncbi:hypothetical protein G6F40_015726 [Rhizopus arrhizus]|nr:hypothetical protein G6F40_015726 [Rhizopus arrhizus]